MRPTPAETPPPAPAPIRTPAASAPIRTPVGPGARPGAGDPPSHTRTADAFATLTAFARDLLAAPPFETVTARAVELALQVCDASFASVEIDDPDGGEPIVHRAFRTGDRPRLTPRGPAADWSAAPLAVTTEIRADTHAVGRLLVADHGRRNRFDPLEVRVLRELADLVGAAHRDAAGRAARLAVTDAARHDVRVPVTVARELVGRIRRSADRLTPARVAELLEPLGEALADVERLADQCLLDERLAAGLTPTVAEVPLRELLDGVRAALGVLAEQRGVTLTVVVDAGSPATIACDPTLTRQALENLVVNAIRHSTAGAPVTVTARATGPRLRVEVADRGPGIPADEQAALFDRFTRTHQSRRDHLPGTGLGLSIVKRLVDAQGGTVGVSSAPGRGSCFWIELPVRPPRRSPAPRWPR